MTEKKGPLILLAEDDEDDIFLLKEALNKEGWRGELQTARDGEELLRVLREGARPDLILLDLNMPRIDGREALTRIKSDPELRVIPVVVLTTSAAESDIVDSYRKGANSYVLKSSEFDRLLYCIGLLGKYWFEAVTLPRPLT